MVQTKPLAKQSRTTTDNPFRQDSDLDEAQDAATSDAGTESGETVAKNTAASSDNVVLSGIRAIIPLDIHEEIHTILHPTNQLIDSPQRIEPALLRPFQNGSKKVTLLFVQNQKTLSATAQSFHNTYLIADTEFTTFRCKRDEIVLVLFPVSAQFSYVLQTSVDEVYAFRLQLRYGDPRYDARRRVQIAAPITLRPTPPAVVTAITGQQVRLFRQITLPLQGAPSAGGGCIADVLYETDAPRPSTYMQTLKEMPIISCRLKDISRGGVGLFLTAEVQSEELLHRLVLLDIPLSNVPITLSDQEQMAITLKLFGVIRGIRTTPPPGTLHIRFLKRLPKKLSHASHP